MIKKDSFSGGNSWRLTKRWIIPVLLLSVVALSCSRDIVWSKSEKIAPEGWDYENKIEFQFEATDTTTLYDIFLDVRNNQDYPFRNLILFFNTELPDGTHITDTIETYLATPTGEWTGSGFGSIRSNEFHFRRDVWFPQTGKYNFSIHHAMRKDKLQGIVDIGVTIKKK